MMNRSIEKNFERKTIFTSNNSDDKTYWNYIHSHQGSKDIFALLEKFFEYSIEKSTVCQFGLAIYAMVHGSLIVFSSNSIASALKSKKGLFEERRKRPSSLQWLWFCIIELIIYELLHFLERIICDPLCFCKKEESVGISWSAKLPKSRSQSKQFQDFSLAPTELDGPHSSSGDPWQSALKCFNFNNPGQGEDEISKSVLAYLTHLKMKTSSVFDFKAI